MRASMFNVRVPLDEIGHASDVFLMNTFTDAQLIVSSEVANLLDRLEDGELPETDEALDALATLTEHGFVVSDREEEFVEACYQRGWPSEILSNGHVRVEHGGVDVTPVLNVLRDLGLSSMEITPSPNALEEMYVQALEKAHGPA